jgi:hypothetical protein
MSLGLRRRHLKLANLEESSQIHSLFPTDQLISLSLSLSLAGSPTTPGSSPYSESLTVHYISPSTYFQA